MQASIRQWLGLPKKRARRALHTVAWRTAAPTAADCTRSLSADTEPQNAAARGAAAAREPIARAGAAALADARCARTATGATSAAWVMVFIFPAA
jgi:hypothetical protein